MNTPRFPFVKIMHLRPPKEDSLSTRDKMAQFYIAPKLSFFMEVSLW